MGVCCDNGASGKKISIKIKRKKKQKSKDKYDEINFEGERIYDFFIVNYDVIDLIYNYNVILNFIFSL